MKAWILWLAVLVLAGCGGSMMSAAGGAGAQAGGAKDIGLARAKIAAGNVPDPKDFPVEGLYAEHDLPLDGPACSSVLCLRLGEGVASTLLEPDPIAFVQVGLSSGLDLSSFRRPKLNLAVVIDHSGSMGTDKMEAAKDAVHRLIDQLDESDVLTVVEFDDRAKVLIGPEAVTDRERFHAQVKRIRSAGGTCIECGLRLGYERVRQRAGDGRFSRVMLLTDAQPNVGATGKDDFLGILREGAAEGIGMTAFGVGLDFGQQLVTALSAERGCNYVYLETPEKTRKVFDEDLAFLVTPIAYDLSLELSPADKVTVKGSYGIPGEEPDEARLAMNVKTVFLSRNRGAITTRLSAPAPSSKLLRARLSWTPLEGSAESVELEATMPEGKAPVFGQIGTRKAFALTEMALVARAACQDWSDAKSTQALEKVKAVTSFLSTEASALGDEGLAREAELMAQLGRNMGGT